MSKVLVFLLIALTALSGPVLAAQKTPVIAMITWRGQTEAERGFVDGLKQSIPDVELIWRHADQDLRRLEKIIAEIKETPVDLIYVFGTSATQTVLKHITDTPIVFNIVTQPVASGIIQSWEHSGNNAVGTSNQVPVENQLKALKKVVPFKRLGIIYNPNETNSRIQRDMALRQQKTLGFTLIDFEIASRELLPDVLSRLQGRVDAVFIPADSLMISLGEELARRINSLHLPSLVTVANLVEDHGLLMGLMPSYYQLGLMAAQKAERVLKGECPNDIPSSHLEFFQITVNLKTARKIGVQIPMSILVIANKIIH